MMKKQMKLLLTLGFLMMNFNVAQAASGDSNWSFLNFRVSPEIKMQRGAVVSSKNNFSTNLSWNPEYAYSEKLYFGLDLGAARYKNFLSQKFFSIGYQAVVGYWVTDSIGLEFAAGAQTWTKRGGTHPMLGGNVEYRFTPWLGVIDRVVAGYSAVLAKNYYTDIIRLGVGLSF